MSEIRVYHNQDKNAFDLKINNRPDKLIAAIYHRERNKRRLNLREAEIYAKLFAAAPETKKQRDAMLDALKHISAEEGVYKARGIGYDAVIAEIANTAIALAEKEGAEC